MVACFRSLRHGFLCGVIAGWWAIGASTIVAQEIPDRELIFRPPDETMLYGRQLPDIRLIRADQSEGTLSDEWKQRPVFITLVFSRCAGICSPYLGLLRSTVKQVGASGDRYQMVVISFDLRDDPTVLAALAEHHGLQDDSGWTFAVPASENELAELCQALDFDFRWDEERQQYNHPAVTVAASQGKVLRLSVGEEISPGRFKEMLAEARGEFVPIYPTPGERLALFRCFDYDPARGFTPNWGMLLLIAPGALALLVVGSLFGFARGKRQGVSKRRLHSDTF